MARVTAKICQMSMSVILETGLNHVKRGILTDFNGPCQLGVRLGLDLRSLFSRAGRSKRNITAHMVEILFKGIAEPMAILRGL